MYECTRNGDVYRRTVSALSAATWFARAHGADLDRSAIAADLRNGATLATIGDGDSIVVRSLGSLGSAVAQ